jgi:hypothetical protein
MKDGNVQYKGLSKKAIQDISNAIALASNVVEAVYNNDSKQIIRLMKSMKPRSRKQGRMIRKAEKLLKYPTLIGYSE